MRLGVTTAFALLLVLAAAGVARAADDPLGPVERSVQAKLTATREAGPLVLHWAPDEVTKEQVDEAEKRSASFYADVEKRLGVKVPVRVHVYLYPSSERMRELTNRKANSVAWSDRHVIHAPHDYGDCHEMVHVFAQHIPADEESSAPEGFFVEGLACALQARDEGVPMSDWCAVNLRAGRLPSLVALRRTWPEGAPKATHPYHPAGSFTEFLIERFGIDKVKKLYTHSLEFQGTLGASFVALERDWRTWLSQRDVPAAHAKFVLGRLGFGREDGLPESLREAKGRSLFDGKSLSGWTPERADAWKVADGRLVGRHDGPWTKLSTSASCADALGARVRFRMKTGDAFKVGLNDGDGASSEVIFAAWATFLCGTATSSGTVFQKDAACVLPGVWNDVVFVNEAGSGRVYLNGILLVESVAALPTADGAITLSVEKGTVEVASVEAIAKE